MSSHTFYLNAYAWGNDILYRGFRDGRRVRERIKYQPTLYMATKEATPTSFGSIHGQPVEPITFPTIRDAKDFAKDRKNVYGYDKYAYMFLAETFMEEIKFDPSLVRVAWLDIETDMEGGASSPDEAKNEITLITFKVRDTIISLGCGDYTPHQENVKYIKCKNEIELLRRFLLLWNKEEFCPDIVSGWNISGYDIPYMVNRIRNVLGDDYAKRMSPWNILQKKHIVSMGKDREVEYPVGIAVLDYLDLYKKMTVGVVDTPDDYKLNTIAHNELGQKKLDYSEYDGLLGLQKENFQKYTEYNIVDVELVEKIDAKRKLINLAIAMAFTARCNFEDVLGTVRQWETILHHDLITKGVVVPARQKKEKRELVGAFVKEPTVGSYDWVVSFDETSLYPTIQMHFNISLETRLSDAEREALRDKVTGDALLCLDQTDYDVKFIDKLLNKELDLSFLKEHDLTMTANGQLYRRSPNGVMPSILEKIFNDRVVSKKKMIEAKNRYEETKSKEDKDEISYYDNRQMCAKIFLNSGYGSLSNVSFLFFEHENAEAITSSGQLIIKWIAKKFNEVLNQQLKTQGIDYVIMVDTDSNYLNLGPLVAKYLPGLSQTEILEKLDHLIKTKIAPLVDAAHEELSDYLNSAKRKLSMKRESICSRGIVIGKKYYILNILDEEGVRFKEPKIKLKGIAAVKSSTPISCREKTKQAIKLIMNGQEADVIKFISDFREEFEHLPFDEIAFPRGINGMDKFKDEVSLCKKGTPIQVRAALLYNEMLVQHGLTNYPLIYNGEKIRYAYLRLPNILKQNVIGTPGPLPKSFRIDEYIDRDTMFEKAFETPLRSIMNAIGWKMSEENTLF